MFNKKNASQDVFSIMDNLIKKASVNPRKEHLSKGIDKLAKAIDILDKHNLVNEADVISLFLEKLAGDRQYSDCMKKLAFSSKEHTQSNAILNTAIDSLDADSVLDVELDDNLSDALERMDEDEEL